MGLNRTTFGRHTSIQKSKYVAKSNDLFAEIMRIYASFVHRLDDTLYKTSASAAAIEPDLVLPVIERSSGNNSGRVKIAYKRDLEFCVEKFYNEVMELMQPPAQFVTRAPPADAASDTWLSGNAAGSVLHSPFAIHMTENRMPFNVLVAFCLIFDYNMLTDNAAELTTSRNSRRPVPSMTEKEAEEVAAAAAAMPLQPVDLNIDVTKRSQVEHITKQVRWIDTQFSQFAFRVKVIYFLLIMYTSLSAHALDSPCSDDLLAFCLTDDSNDIQRTFIDLLNSELDFQKNTVASTRVNLLLRIDQFI
jgi:hypothetical protein